MVLKKKKKKGCGRVSQSRDDGELNERGAASDEFAEILIGPPMVGRKIEEEIRVKELGLDTPHLIISQQTEEQNKASELVRAYEEADALSCFL